jgi:hypothetical protein
MPTITNKKMVRIFEVLSSKFTLTRISTTDNYTQKWTTKHLLNVLMMVYHTLHY